MVLFLLEKRKAAFKSVVMVKILELINVTMETLSMVMVVPKHVKFSKTSTAKKLMELILVTTLVLLTLFKLKLTNTRLATTF